jgi:anti-anti-sigma regulatory factor
MTLKVKKHNTTVNILDIPTGKLEFSGCVSINKAIIRLAKVGTRNVVINFKHSTDIDNIFIDMLLSVGKYCDKKGCRLSLCDMEPDMLCAFYLLKLDRYFEIYDTTDDALCGRNRLVKRMFRVV